MSIATMKCQMVWCVDFANVYQQASCHLFDIVLTFDGFCFSTNLLNLTTILPTDSAPSYRTSPTWSPSVLSYLLLSENPYNIVEIPQSLQCCLFFSLITMSIHCFVAEKTVQCAASFYRSWLKTNLKRLSVITSSYNIYTKKSSLNEAQLDEHFWTFECGSFIYSLVIGSRRPRHVIFQLINFTWCALPCVAASQDVLA